MKEKIKKSKILYFIFHNAKAITYFIWGYGAWICFEFVNFFVKCGIIKQDKRFENIKKYKNIHSGKRCFIVATGPSMTIDDLNSLCDEYTISMNSIVNLYDKTSFRPTYYVIQDKTVFDKVKKYYDNIDMSKTFIGIGNVGKKCKSSIVLENVKKYKDSNLFHVNTAEILFHLNFNHKKFNPKFSYDCAKQVEDGTTITYSAIQLAIYMGFKDIYLVGVDCNYSGPVKHISEYGNEKEFDENIVNWIQEKQMKSFEKAYKASELKNVNLYNATRGGKLEKLPRVDIDTLLRKYK